LIEVSEHNETMAVTQTLDGRKVPWTRWSILTIIAVVGSCVYGASLALALPNFDLARGAIWITIAAGGGWAALIPALWRTTGVQLRDVFDACLVTMAVGEGVLFLGALTNLALRGALIEPAALNYGIVFASNVAMAAALSGRLRSHGVAPLRTVTLWMLVLNGVGALLFFLLYRVLFAGGVA